MKHRAPSIDELFQPLKGVPSWHVKKGYGSFLTFEFGTPSQEIREPRTVSNSSPLVRELLARRCVTIHGQWHLWVYCCGWRIRMADSELAHNESSDDEIAAACLELDGQAIQNVKCEPKFGRTRFHFDLGGVLETAPYNDELLEQWMLYLPDGNVYTYRSDGAASFGPGSRDMQEWELGGEQSDARKSPVGREFES
ncbi:MAG: hypothetical protein KF851_01695 [Pirellulaceae bacterium]|nr:hypothetical protein [Pirellulaceae bacterium]